MRHYFIYSLLLALKFVTRLFYRVEMRFIGNPVPDPWENHRVVAFLHHTSLFEPVFLGGVPNSFLRRVAFHGVVPAADKTIERPLVGMLFKLIAAHVIPISRQRDNTWFEVLRRIDPESMVIILPEGRMMRKNGLDSNGQPMTVRGGIADVIEAIGEGRMLVAYSGGLHHIQAPGEHVPRVFETARMNLEVIEIKDYVAELLKNRNPEQLKRAVRDDFERRRDENCPFEPGQRPLPNGTTA
ncbi:MAG: hypothetical protein WC538_11210 [Thermoanaerobaculia bacterium]|jgi:hypothetical protein